jgi:flagellar L-ring protein precursor FlgH
MKTMSKFASKHLLSNLLALVLFGSMARAGSIWPVNGSGEHGIYADRKASRSGDILTIVVNETVAATNSQSTSTSRDSTISDAVSSFLYPTTLAHKGALPAVSIAGKAAYDGSGATTNNQSLASRAAVLVTDVLPNGNLVIEGMRVVTFSGETQYVILHGIVRSDDIGSDNTVQSTNVAEAHVEFVAEGTITDSQKRGWMAKLYEMFRPF